MLVVLMIVKLFADCPEIKLNDVFSHDGYRGI